MPAIKWSTKTEPTERNERVVAALAKALGHPLRVRILRILMRTNSQSCQELVDALPIAQATVSQHLKVLAQAGLVSARAEGPSRRYSINPPALARLKNAVDALAERGGLARDAALEAASGDGSPGAR